MNIIGIIPAGGSSSRYKKGNKLLELLNGKPVIVNTVEVLLSSEKINQIIIPASEELKPILEEMLKAYSNINIVLGGKTRQESVYNALKACKNCDYVAIHDAARPLITKKIIEKCLASVIDKKAVIAAVKAIDTIKIVDKDNKIIETPNRETLWNVQTPQVFNFELIFSVHQQLEGQNYSDDAGMLEKIGTDVFVVESEYTNFKITTEKDLLLAQLITTKEQY